jgi:hypothetical protein
MDPNNIQDMQDWPCLKTLKSLKGFLGLIRYYRKFFHHYGKIARPLMVLLKKNAFQWTLATKQAFLDLKQAMCTTPVFTFPGFNKKKLVESDASITSIGAVLTQDGQPLAFTSQALSGHNLDKSTYEKEIMAILHVVHTWRPYLLGRHFQIKTNHHSLKYFLKQRLSSLKQNKWLTKMLGYDYEIIYKKAK